VPPREAERLLCLVNAPPIGDTHQFTTAEIQQCERNTFERLERCGLRVLRDPQATCVTTPSDFNRLFPATGGALYGPASHGWRSSFTRPGSRSRIPGLYLAGGSTHPGPGVPMAALSGRLAAASLRADYGSTA
jgi:1-hydroxycarotenoid 3,4-desaturase